MRTVYSFYRILFAILRSLCKLLLLEQLSELCWKQGLNMAQGFISSVSNFRNFVNTYTRSTDKFSNNDSGTRSVQYIEVSRNTLRSRCILNFLKILGFIIFINSNTQIVHASIGDVAGLGSNLSNATAGASGSGGATDASGSGSATGGLVTGVVGDIIDTIVQILTELTCETQGVNDLLRQKFSHTCIPDTFLSIAVANIVSPGLYSNLMLRLKINNKELFPEGCSRKNRADPKDPTITFGVCNNILLFLQRIKSIIMGAVQIASAIVTGEAPWNAIKEAWNVPVSEYHLIFNDKREGQWGVIPDYVQKVPGVFVKIPIVQWGVTVSNDRICVSTLNLLAQYMPVGCKYIKEPYPVSVYSEFVNPDAPKPEYSKEPVPLMACSNAGNCYSRAYKASRAGYTVSAPLIECIKEMSAKMMISREVCSFDDLNMVANTSLRQSSTLFQFQKNMHTAVTALLTIYVIFFGFRMLLSGEAPKSSEIGNFIIKFLFVTYFSIGINANAFVGNDNGRLDGLIQWVIPFMLNGMTQMASWITTVTPSELCKFDVSEYEPGMQHIAVWDALDCRISHYLGLDMIQTFSVERANNNNDTSVFDSLSFPIPPYIYLLIPALISGQITLIMLALMYPLMVLSVGAFVVYMTVVCIISIVILAMLAPIFVPMYLFEFTKGYFESWAKLLLSFMLQPMVAVTFMTSMMAVYDYGFYGTCKYKSAEYGSETNITKTFESVIDALKESGAAPPPTSSSSNTSGSSGGGKDSPESDNKRRAKFFFINKDWDDTLVYPTKKEVYGCQNSLGYMLNNPFTTLFEAAKGIITGEFPSLDPVTTGVDSNDQYEFMGAVQQSPGLLFNTFDLIFEWIRKFILALLTAIITLFLMYHFSESLAYFAADMTEGIAISRMTALRPQSIYKGAMSAIGSMRGRGASDRAGSRGGSGASDRVSSGPSGASRDKFSTGSEDRKAGDKVSTGSSGGGASGSSRGGASGSSRGGASDKISTNQGSENKGGNAGFGGRSDVDSSRSSGSSSAFSATNPFRRSDNNSSGSGNKESANANKSGESSSSATNPFRRNDNNNNSGNDSSKPGDKPGEGASSESPNFVKQENASVNRPDIDSKKLDTKAPNQEIDQNNNPKK